MKMKTNWLEKWEHEKESREELLLYQNELDNAINEVYTLKQQLKVYEYRIEKLNEIIKDLNNKL